MIKKILILVGILSSCIFSQGINDKDFDGVPDTIDECPNTPFLNEVDSTGCTTNILTLPFETEKESLVLTLGYGFSTNNDLKNRELQHNTKIKISYYLHNWAYSLQTGYYAHQQDDGTIDTIIRIRKRIKINPNFAINVGAGLRLPSYDFPGNKTDALLYTSLHYYPTASLSCFAGYTYTRIGDDEIPTVVPETPSNNPGNNNGKEGSNENTNYEGLQNTNNFYFGFGYFFTKNFYMNLGYSNENNKFVSEHNIKSVNSSIYYKIDESWFTTLYYKREIDDGDLHDNLLFTLGYTF
jgi:hypothetical protein